MYCIFFRINNLGQSVKIVLLTKDKDLERLRQIVKTVFGRMEVSLRRCMQ